MYAVYVLKSLLTIFLVLFVVILPATATQPTDSDVRALYTHLLDGYDTRIRPTTNQSKAVVVSVYFALTNILDFQTASQKFDVLGYFFFTWTDEFLKWNISQYSGVGVMKIPQSQIWTPTIIISKIYDGESKVGHVSDRVAVTWDGSVTWQPEGTYHIICEVQITFYPFDQQICVLTFYVSDESLLEVELIEDSYGGVRTDKFTENSEWKLLEVYAEREVEYGAYIMNVNIALGRRFEFILFTVIAPLIILSVLNLCVFLVPIESEEKGSFSVTIFLSYGVFVSEISSSLPHNSLNLPYLLIYMLLLLIFSVLTVIYAIIQSRIFTLKADQPVNLVCLKSFCQWKQTKVTPIQSIPPNPGCMTAFEMKEKVTPIQSIPLEPDCKTAFETKKEDPDLKPQPDQGQMTWREFLRKIDFVAFCVFLVIISTCTTYFFFSMINTRAIY